jgi:hypothetical protein
VRLQKDHLHATNHGRLEGRSRDEREEVRHVGKRLRRGAQSTIDFALQLGEI